MTVQSLFLYGGVKDPTASCKHYAPIQGYLLITSEKLDAKRVQDSAREADERTNIERVTALHL